MKVIRLLNSFQNLQLALHCCSQNFVGSDQRTPLLTLFGNDSDICEAFLNQHDAVQEACSLEQELLANLSHQIDTIPASVKNPAIAHMATEIVGRLQSDLAAIAD